MDSADFVLLFCLFPVGTGLLLYLAVLLVAVIRESDLGNLCVWTAAGIPCAAAVALGVAFFALWLCCMDSSLVQDLEERGVVVVAPGGEAEMVVEGARASLKGAGRVTSHQVSCSLRSEPPNEAIGSNGTIEVKPLATKTISGPEEWGTYIIGSKEARPRFRFTLQFPDDETLQGRYGDLRIRADYEYPRDTEKTTPVGQIGDFALDHVPAFENASSDVAEKRVVYFLTTSEAASAAKPDPVELCLCALGMSFMGGGVVLSICATINDAVVARIRGKRGQKSKPAGTVPRVLAMSCPRCGAQSKALPRDVGKRFKCPKCGEPFVLKS